MNSRDDEQALPTVCHLLFSMVVGGAEMLAKDIAESGAGRFRFVFACLDGEGALGEELRASGYVVETLGRVPGIDLGCVRRLAAFCKKHHVDLIHAHLCGPYRYAGLARLLGPKFPILVTEHGREFPDSTTLRRRMVNRLLLGRRDRFIGVGNFLTEALAVNEGIPRSRIDVIYNGRDLGKYGMSSDARAAARRELGLSDSDVAVMQVARLSPIKDHVTAVKAIALVAKEHPNVRHVIVGDGPCRDQIEEVVDRLQLRENVILLGMRDDVDRLLPAADLFLLTSLSEAIPLTLIEAMAAEIPCIGSRVGGVPEVIADGETGLLAASESPQEFADQILKLIDDRETRLRMGSLARRRSEQLFDRNAMQDAYYALYRQMTNSHSCGGGSSAPEGSGNHRPDCPSH